MMENTRPKRLLVVDDEANVVDVVALTLTAAGYEVITARNFDDAELALEKDSFDGAIIDVWLGSHDGLDLGAKMSASTPPVPFMVMSGGGKGKTLETVTARADALGATMVLFKPFDDDELLDGVHKMVSR